MKKVPKILLGADLYCVNYEFWGNFIGQERCKKTVRLDKDVLEFYQKMALANGIP